MKDLSKLTLPDLLLNKLETLEDPEQILDNLKFSLTQLQKKGIQLIKPLTGGTSAFVGMGQKEDGQEVVIKIPLSKIEYSLDFDQELEVLRLANGNGYVQLLDYDTELNVAIMEYLGEPLGTLGYSVDRQLEIICQTLKASWVSLTTHSNFSNTLAIADWFSDFIQEHWTTMQIAGSKKLLDRVNQCIAERKQAFNPQSTVLVHGDAHNYNLLKDHSTNQFKLIDPDGIISEPAYDLGVLLREWIDEIVIDPIKRGFERLNFLHELTGVDKRAIWQWGLIQCVATGLILLTTRQEEEGRNMMKVAEAWKEVPLKFY